MSVHHDVKLCRVMMSLLFFFFNILVCLVACGSNPLVSLEPFSIQTNKSGGFIMIIFGR